MSIQSFLRLLAIFALVGFSPFAHAATPTEPDAGERLRVGLVLGGGGARGAAHIGVLRELERLRIPIDAIAGTSMGAIVGSLYASGKTPQQLEELVGSIDWADAFTDSTAREQLSFRRKEDDASFPVRFELGLRDGQLLLPRGLIQGQKLQLILREQFLHVSHIDNFDNLPVPFRAVASDIENGEAFVMTRGDLALAARASMSAPGIFAPVTIDGRTLVDGGLVGNLPVDVMREMDVDVVIAVDVEFPLYEESELGSALGITEQMLTILIRKETQRQIAQLGENDILIRPDLGQHGSTDFAAIGDTIEPGAQATLAVTESLSRLSLTEKDYAQYVSARLAPAALPETIDFVRIRKDGRVSEKTLAAKIETEAGDVFSARQLADDAATLYGMNSFENVGYQLVRDGEQVGVEFETRAKSWGPNYLKFGLEIEDDFEGTTAFNLATRLTMTGLNALGAEWRNDLQLGIEPYFDTEFYQPLEFNSRYFVATRAKVGQQNIRTFTGNDSTARYRRTTAEIGLDVGAELGQFGEFRIGILRGLGDARRKVGDPSLPNFDFDRGALRALLRIDTYDDAQVPSSGSRVSLESLFSRPGLGADNDFDTYRLSADRAWSWGRNTIRTGMEFATTMRDSNPLQDEFRLGGFLRLSGLDRGEIRGPHAGLLRLMYYRRVGKTGGGLFDIPLYVGGSFEAGNTWQSRSSIDFDSLIANGSIFAGVDTYFGLLFLSAGFAENGDSSFYLFLGNPRQR